MFHRVLISYIYNLISYIYNRALVAFVTLETFHFCVSTWLSNCMRTETNICFVQNFLEGTLLLVQKLKAGGDLVASVSC